MYGMQHVTGTAGQRCLCTRSFPLLCSLCSLLLCRLCFLSFCCLLFLASRSHSLYQASLVDGKCRPQVGCVERYLERGPSFIFLFHPALGPLWDVIAQKLRGGALAPGAELVLEVRILLPLPCSSPLRIWSLLRLLGLSFPCSSHVCLISGPFYGCWACIPFSPLVFLSASYLVFSIFAGPVLTAQCWLSSKHSKQLRYGSEP